MCSSLVSELTIYILSCALIISKISDRAREKGMDRKTDFEEQFFFNSAYSKILRKSETYVPNKVYRLF